MKTASIKSVVAAITGLSGAVMAAYYGYANYSAFVGFGGSSTPHKNQNYRSYTGCFGILVGDTYLALVSKFRLKEQQSFKL